MIALVAHWKLRDGCPDELDRALKGLCKEVEQNEPGTLLFSVGTPGAWPPIGPPPDYEVVDLAPQPRLANELVFIEVYADAEAFAAHLRGSFRVFLDRHRHRFETPWQGQPRPTVTWIDPRWVMSRQPSALSVPKERRVDEGNANGSLADIPPRDEDAVR
ncbi:putative quinol monooxygenase [Sorangium sp. So ce385]|uniref:putative quinol monooxygenase n=1 Tax=Sorangium sp. So ce385 TaxID=3133308 RepID=UPI003F5B04BD